MNRIPLSTSWNGILSISLNQQQTSSLWMKRKTKTIIISKRTILSSFFNSSNNSNNTDQQNHDNNNTKRYVISNYIIPTYPIHLFNIILDVNSYHEFLPFCTHSQILTNKTKRLLTMPNNNITTTNYNQHDTDLQQKQESHIRNINMNNISDNNNSFEATMTIGFPPFIQETYISNVIIDPINLICESISIESQLFNSLYSKWHLQYYNNIPSSSSNNVNDNDHINYYTNVNFEVSITSNDPIILHTLDTVLEKVATQQINAFKERCLQIPFRPIDNNK